MWNSFRSFIRSVRAQRVVASMNVIGLSLGLAVAVLAGYWTINEFSYDHFHRDGDRMFRVLKHFYWDNQESVGGSVFRPLGEMAKAEIPEVEKICRVVALPGEQVKAEDVLFPKNRVLVTDDNFFDFFTFPLKEGEVSAVLSLPGSMVIDETTARKLFSDGDAVGGMIRYADRDWRVSGVMYDMPSNSHIRGNIVVGQFGPWKEYSWGGSDQYVTYFTLHPGADVDAIQEKLTRLGWESMSFLKEAKVKHTLEPMRDVYFGTGFNEIKGNKPMIIAFDVAAFIILLISGINFTSLFISTSFLRARAIGIRKTHGAGKRSLVAGFYLETFYYVAIAAIVALLAVWTFLPVFNSLTGAALHLDFMAPALYLFILPLLLFMVLLAGTFPAFYMTRFNTVQTLGGEFKGRNLSFLQKGLLVAQFTVAIAFLLSVLFIQKQVHYMVSKDLGFDKENVMYIEAQGAFARNYDALRGDLLQCPEIKDITMKNSLPQSWVQGWPVKKKESVEKKGSMADYDFMTEICRVRENYFDMMKMKLVAGENPFYAVSGGAGHECVINETAARLLGHGQEIGFAFEMNGQDYIVKGVVKDAQTKSLYRPVDPQVYLDLEPEGNNVILFKIQGNPQQVIRKVKETWAKMVPGMPFDFGFLDRDYEQLYWKELDLARMMGWMTSLTILLCVSGLFNMSYYAASRRMKEMSIRKINGATVPELLALLNKELVGWVFIASVAACPLACLFISRWQESFVEKTALSWWVFMVTALVALCVALLTVSYQTWKTANVNPVKVLKSE